MKSRSGLASFWRVILLGIFALMLTACGGGSDSGEAAIIEDSNISIATEVQLKAWIGASDTEIILPEQAQGLTLTRSTDSDCDLANYSVCAKGQQDILSTTNLTDTAANTTNPAWYWLQNENLLSNKLAITSNQFSSRNAHQAISFNNKLFLIGGWDGYKPTNDIWSSNDGINWIQETPNASFSARYGHELVFFNEKLWLIGGEDDTGQKNDAWSSIDGINWIQETVNANFSPRSWHTITSFNNKLWLIAGWDGSKQKNDI